MADSSPYTAKSTDSDEDPDYEQDPEDDESDETDSTDDDSDEKASMNDDSKEKDYSGDESTTDTSDDVTMVTDDEDTSDSEDITKNSISPKYKLINKHNVIAQNVIILGSKPSSDVGTFSKHNISAVKCIPNKDGKGGIEEKVEKEEKNNDGVKDISIKEASRKVQTDKTQSTKIKSECSVTVEKCFHCKKDFKSMQDLVDHLNTVAKDKYLHAKKKRQFVDDLKKDFELLSESEDQKCLEKTNAKEMKLETSKKNNNKIGDNSIYKADTNIKTKTETKNYEHEETNDVNNAESLEKKVEQTEEMRTKSESHCIDVSQTHLENNISVLNTNILQKHVTNQFEVQPTNNEKFKEKKENELIYSTLIGLDTEILQPDIKVLDDVNNLAKIPQQQRKESKSEVTFQYYTHVTKHEDDIIKEKDIMFKHIEQIDVEHKRTIPRRTAECAACSRGALRTQTPAPVSVKFDPMHCAECAAAECRRRTWYRDRRQHCGRTQPQAGVACGCSLQPCSKLYLKDFANTKYHQARKVPNAKHYDYRLFADAANYYSNNPNNHNNTQINRSETFMNEDTDFSKIRQKNIKPVNPLRSYRINKRCPYNM